MVRRPIAALVCVLLITTAGCSGLINQDSQNTVATSTTPAETTTTSPTTTAPSEQLAPGVTSAGVTNALALANAHQEVVRGHAFVKHASTERTNGTTTLSRETMLRYSNESHWLLNRTGDGIAITRDVTNGTLSEYADGKQVLYRIQADGNVSFGFRQIGPNADSPKMPPARALPEQVYERDLVYTLAANAESVVSVDSAAVKLSGNLDDLSLNGKTVTNISYNATFAENGQLQSAMLTYDYEDMRGEYSLSFDTTVSSPVTEPSWYETALNQTSI